VNDKCIMILNHPKRFFKLYPPVHNTSISRGSRVLKTFRELGILPSIRMNVTETYCFGKALATGTQIRKNMNLIYRLRYKLLETRI
jgi:hypothetical protein